MDELALLKEFRLEDASPDDAREHARAALERAMTRRRLPRRRYTVVLAFALAAVLAAASYAIVHQFVIGSAAPKDVQDEIGSRLAVIGGSNLLAPGSPYKLVEPARIAAGTQSPAGPVYMLLGRIKGGGECQFVWYSGKRTPGGLPITSGACGLGKQRHARGFGYAYEFDGSSPGHPYTLIEGYAPGAVRMRIGNRFYRTPYGWFIAVYRGHELLTAYGVHGGVVARVRLKSSEERASSAPARPVVPVVPTKPGHVVISTRTGWVKGDIRVRPTGRTSRWILTNVPVQVSVAPNNKGGRCIYVHVDSRTDSDAPGCGFPRLRSRELEAMPYPIGWVRQKPRSGWVQGLSVLGEAGVNITKVDMHFSDGSSAAATLREGVIFYLVPRRNFAAGHRPTQLVGRDASGRIVARKRLTFGS